MHQAVILILFVGSLSLVFDLTTLLTFGACGIKVQRFVIFASKPCVTLQTKRFPIDIGFIPWGGGHVSFDNEAFRKLPLKTRLLALSTAPLMLLVIASSCLSIDLALRQFLTGLPEFVCGGLAPYERGVPLIREFFRSTNESIFVGYGIFAAKWAVFNLIPIYATRGGRILTELLGLQVDTAIKLNSIGVLILLPLLISWFVALARYAQTNPFLLASLFALPYAAGYIWTRVTRKSPPATAPATELSKVALYSFKTAVDAYRAAFDATALLSTRASHREAIIIAHQAREEAPAGDANARKAYEDAIIGFTDSADFERYTETDLDAHTSALDKLTAAFETLLVAYSGFADVDNSADEAFTFACKSYTSAANAYSKAAFCATSDAMDIKIQASKARLDGNEREIFTAETASPDSMGKVSGGKARDTEAGRKYTALLNKANAAEAKAKAALAKAKVAVEAFTTAAGQHRVKPSG